MRLLPALCVLALLLAVASASQGTLSAPVEKGSIQEEGIGDVLGQIGSAISNAISNIKEAASAIVKKGTVMVKMQALVDAIQAASPGKIAKIPDDVVKKTIENQLEQTTAGLVKATINSTLPGGGIDKQNAGADKKAKPAGDASAGATAVALIELQEETMDSDPVLAEAKQIVANANVAKAITELNNALIDENTDKIKVPKAKALVGLQDKITTAVVELLQRGDGGAKKIAVAAGAAGAAAGAAAGDAAAAPAAPAAPPKKGKANAAPRFRRVFRQQAERAKAATSFSLEISAKSYIRPLSSSGCWVICPDVFGYVIDPVCSGAAIAFCASMGPMGVLSDTEAYGPGGNFRLYSKHRFNMQCDGGRVTSVTPAAREGKVGKEGPLQGQPENGDYDRIVARVAGGEAHVGYMFSGRPNRLAEPGFQALKLRTCTWIWHFPYFKIQSCTAGGGWNGEFQFGGSNFPTRRLWQDGREISTIQQGRIDALWNASPADRALVDGWFPYGFAY